MCLCVQAVSTEIGTGIVSDQSAKTPPRGSAAVPPVQQKSPQVAARVAPPAPMEISSRGAAAYRTEIATARITQTTAARLVIATEQTYKVRASRHSGIACTALTNGGL